MTPRAFVNAKDTNGSLLATRIGYQNNSERREKNLKTFVCFAIIHGFRVDPRV